MRLFRWLAGLFRPAVRREIFRYWDGRKYRYADPLSLLQKLDDSGDWRAFVQRAVLSVEIDPATASPALAAQLTDKAKLVGDIAQLVRDVFGVLPLTTGADGRPLGLTNVECVGLLSRFMVWCADTSEAYRPLASWPGRLVASPAESDTADWSDSTSTATS